MKKIVPIIVIVLAAAGVYYMNTRPAKAPPASMAVPASVEAPKPAEPAFSLEQSDGVVQERAKSLSSDARLGRWLKNESIIRRVVAAAAIISDGNSPKDSLGFLAPGKRFSTVKKRGGLYLNPKSYDRYDPIGEVFQSLDTAGTAKLFKDMKPLFQKAYDELGHSKGDVQDILVKAISNLLAAPVVVGDIRLRPKVVSYVMTDDKLEKLSPAQKHLVRMGPENTTKIQNKLREIALALGVPTGQLPQSQTYNPAAK